MFYYHQKRKREKEIRENIEKGLLIAESTMGRKIDNIKITNDMKATMMKIEGEILNLFAKNKIKDPKVIGEMVNVFLDARKKYVDLKWNIAVDLATTSSPFLSIQDDVPGLNYCGPTTKITQSLQAGIPPNGLTDEACLYHDLAYLAIGMEGTSLSKEDRVNLISEADNNLLTSAINISQLLKGKKVGRDDRKNALTVMKFMGAKIEANNRIGLGIADPQFFIKVVKLTDEQKKIRLEQFNNILNDYENLATIISSNKIKGLSKKKL